MKILGTDKPSIGLKVLQKTKVMSVILPEVDALEGIDQRKDFHHKDVFHHTMLVLDNICKSTDNLWLRYTALMHDIAKPPTKRFVEGIGWTFHGHEDLGAKWQKGLFKRLKLPMENLHYVEKLIRLHLRPIALAEHDVTDSAIRRLIFEAGDDLEDLFILCRADITSKDPSKVKEFHGNFDRVEKRIKEVEERDKIRNFQSPVDGLEIMKLFGLEPGRAIGIIKKRITDAILDGEIPNEHDAVYNFLLDNKDNIIRDVSSEKA
jgi:tRNA nucleotidyltransferase/poly(A) polymerase